MAVLEELRRSLTELLPAASASAYRMAAGSALRLGDVGVIQPYWLALRSAKLTWRCRLVKEAGRVRFLFLTVGRTSARERMDAEVTMEVGPVTEAEAPALAGGVAAAQGVELPAGYVPRPDGKLEFKFGSQRPFVVSLDEPTTDLSGQRAVYHIQLDEWPGGGWQGPGEDARWPLEAFVTFAFALASEAVVGGGPTLPLAPPRAGDTHPDQTSLRDFLAELADILTLAPRLVATGDPTAEMRAQLPLSMSWRLVAGSAQLGVLINKDGWLASPEEEDTFLAPCNFQLVPGAVRWALLQATGWPDFVLRGAVRKAALDAFKADGKWDKAARAKPLAVLGCTKEILLSWAEDDTRTVLLRPDRREDDDEVLLVLTGQLQGTEVAVVMHADEVSYKREEPNGEMTARARRFTVVQAGPRAETWMEWDTTQDGGKKLFCDVLHGFLRWHALLRPLLASS